MYYLLVGIGGAIGAILRYSASRVIGFSYNGFPLSTLLVNWSGCFLIGICFALLKDSPQYLPYRLLLITGVLGGFTTFSSFGWETLQLINEDKWKIALSYVLLSNIIGILLVFIGFYLLTKLKIT